MKDTGLKKIKSAEGKTMSKKINAAVLNGPGDLKIHTIKKPEIGPEDVLLKILAVGICGSDLHTYKTGINAYPEQIMGHEFVGEAVELGAKVKGIKLGDRLTGFTVSYCGECEFCKKSDYRMCPRLFDGYSGYGKNGAMAEFMRLENATLGENAFRIPDSLSNLHASMAEPLGTAIYTFFRTKPKPNDKVVVIGAGTIGQFLIQLFKTVENVKVIAVEVEEGRLSLAKISGADVVINPKKVVDLLGVIQEETGIGEYHFGRGANADIVIDAAGTPFTLHQSLQFVKSKGTVGVVAIPEKSSQIDSSLLVYKDIRLIGILGSVIPKGIEYLEKKIIRTDHLISHTFPLEQAQQAFQTAIHDPKAMKVLLIP